MGHPASSAPPLPPTPLALAVCLQSHLHASCFGSSELTCLPFGEVDTGGPRFHRTAPCLTQLSPSALLSTLSFSASQRESPQLRIFLQNFSELLPCRHLPAPPAPLPRPLSWEIMHEDQPSTTREGGDLSDPLPPPDVPRPQHKASMSLQAGAHQWGWGHTQESKRAGG